MKLFTSFPTVVFTFLLAVCLIWWLMSLLLSGLDIDADTDADADGLGDALGFGTMPFPLALTLLAFGGWVTTAVLQRLIAPGDFVLGAAAAIGVLLAACVGGLLLLRLLANPMGKLFAIESAPSLARAVGSVCKVRTLEVGERFGDAAYAAEEPIAELASAFLCAELQITLTPRPDHAQYLGHWLKLLRTDNRAIFIAAARASDAVRFLRSRADAGNAAIP